MARSFRAAGALLAVLATSVPASGNMGLSDWITKASPPVRLEGPRRTLEVARVVVSLDMRDRDRGVSTSTYVLVNPSSEPFEGKVTFLASADVRRVLLDGGDRAFREVPWQGADRAHELTIALGPRQQRSVVVEFVLQEAHHFQVARERYADGLYRGRSLPTMERERLLSYPLWPVVGFGGGVGEIDVTVRTSGIAPRTKPHALPWEPQTTADGGAGYHLVLPRAAAGVGLAADEIEVRSPQESGDPPPIIGGSVFAAGRVSSGDERRLSINARGSFDLVPYGLVGLSVGGETDFGRYGALLATVAKGSASAYGSFYGAASVLVPLRPGPAVGAELGVGGRALIIPLDLAVQIFPYRSHEARELGVVRFLFGVKAGF